VTLISFANYTGGVPTTPTTAPTAPPLPELASQLRLRVMRLSRKLRRRAEAGLSPSLLSALSTVERRGSLTVGALSEAEQVKPPTMTKIVGGLVELALVTRAADPLDRRVGWVTITSEGRRLLRSSRRRTEAYLAGRLRELGPEDLAVLARASDLLEQLTGEAP
jgi:DNA-binding MarR family transcriptional regulator